MTNKSDASKMLKQALRNESGEFRNGQWEAIDAIVNRSERRLVVERTGWGKSTVYFISTRILRESGKGLTLIISPLLALMRNQIESAKQFGVTALTINSTNTDEWDSIVKLASENKIDVLLVSPERLANEDFVNNVLMPISHSIGLFVVDEAHCISDWGHDFRPDYRRIVNILQRMPSNLPILGTTATANNRVIKDIKTQFGNITVQRGGLTRESLVLKTINLPTKASRLAWISQHINSMRGTGIIYTLTKRDAEQVSDWLQKSGTDAHAYYSGVIGEGFKDTDAYREHLEELLYTNKIKVLVATGALGMGYDKPDLGFVIHYQAPSSIITYYQQVGRAGRNIPTAYGILLAGSEDQNIHEFFRKNSFPKSEWVRTILDLLNENDGISANNIQANLNLRSGQIDHVLKFLSVENPSPIIKIDALWHRTAIEYTMDLDKISRLTGQKEVEYNEVLAYIAEQGCLMQYLSIALDDKSPEPCGKCASCVEGAVFDNVIDHDIGVKASEFLNHSELPLKCKAQAAPNAFKVYNFRYNLPQALRAREGKILSVWGEAGWGEIVKRDKRSGNFTEELINAAVEMILDRWKPTPMPTWVTCIPSLNNPNLVPKLAEAIAKKLGIPFYDVVVKIKNNEPQKKQENRFYQCRNLDGVFTIKELENCGPVFLIDDVFDSGWTMTVVSALLLQEGCVDVFPLALASSSVGG